MLEIILLIVSIIIPLGVLILLWSTFLTLSKKRPYISAFLVGLYIAVISGQIFWHGYINRFENLVTDFIVTKYTDRSKNNRQPDQISKYYEKSLFERDIINYKSSYKKRIVKAKLSKNDLELMKKSYATKGEYYYHLKQNISAKDKSQIIKILKKLDYFPDKNSTILYALITQNSINNAEKYFDMGWPWRRKSYGDMINFFSKSGAKAIAFDFVFSEKSVYQTSFQPIEITKKNQIKDIQSVYKNIYEDYNKRKKLFEEDNDDKYFADSAHKFNINVMGFTFATHIKSPSDDLNVIINKLPVERIKVLAKKYKIPVPKKGFNKKQIVSQIIDNILNDENIRPYALNIDVSKSTIQFPRYKKVTSPYKEYLGKVKYIGAVNALSDSDGPYRRTPLIIEFNNRYYPMLSLASYLEFINYKPNEKLKVIGNQLYIRDNLKPIPLDDHGQLRIKYYGGAKDRPSSYDDIFSVIDVITLKEKADSLFDEYKKTFTDTNPLNLNHSKELYQDIHKYTATLNLIKSKLEDKSKKVFEKKYTMEDRNSRYQKVAMNSNINNKVVMICSIAPALLDLRPNPFQQDDPGAHIHVSAIDNLINQDYLQEIPKLYILIFIVIISIVTAWLTGGGSLFRSILTLILFVGGIILLGGYLAFKNNYVISILIPAQSVFLVFLLDTIIHYLAEKKEKGYIKGAFGQYLSPKIIDIIMNDPSKLALGGQRKIITAFFSDVAGFSTISEKLTPEELVALLNHYLTDMCNIIAKYDGTVDKFEGDAIIAFWGAPLDEPQHAKLACFSTIEMQQLMVELRKQYTAEGRDPLIANMRMRVGLNSGPAVVGNMGSKNRMDYTMMGDTVNLAARLEGANKFYGTYSMISDATYEFAKDHIDVRELDKIQVVGKKEAVVVYELLNKKNQTSGDYASGIELYLKAMDLYKQQKFIDAIPVFKSVFQYIPNDPPSKTYIERCDVLKDHPPGPDWDGRYVLTAKG